MAIAAHCTVDAAERGEVLAPSQRRGAGPPSSDPAVSRKGIVSGRRSGRSGILARNCRCPTSRLKGAEESLTVESGGETSSWSSGEQAAKVHEPNAGR